MRDHYSGLFYAEMCRHDQLINLGDFLYRAWSKKAEEHSHFVGVPEHLLVPQVVIEKWPEIKKVCKEYGIPLHRPKSGFEAGSIAVKNWHNAVYSGLMYTENNHFDNLKEIQKFLCLTTESRDKLQKWHAHKTKLYAPKKEHIAGIFTEG